MDLCSELQHQTDRHKKVKHEKGPKNIPKDHFMMPRKTDIYNFIERKMSE